MNQYLRSAVRVLAGVGCAVFLLLLSACEKAPEDAGRLLPSSVAEMGGKLYFTGEKEKGLYSFDGETVTLLRDGPVASCFFPIDDFIYFTDGKNVLQLDPEDDRIEKKELEGADGALSLVCVQKGKLYFSSTKPERTDYFALDLSSMKVKPLKDGVYVGSESYAFMFEDRFFYCYHPNEIIEVPLSGKPVVHTFDTIPPYFFFLFGGREGVYVLQYAEDDPHYYRIDLKTESVSPIIFPEACPFRFFENESSLYYFNDPPLFAMFDPRDILAGDLYRYDPKENQSVLIARDIPYDRKSTGSGVASIGIGVTEHYYFFRYDDPLPDADTEKALTVYGEGDFPAYNYCLHLESGEITLLLKELPK